MKSLFTFLIGFSMACNPEQSVISKHVTIKIYPYEHQGEMKASAMPELKKESELNTYKRRFEYLLINIPAIHLPENAEKRNQIWNLYPDTLKLAELYLNEYVQDKNLLRYFEETRAPLENSNFTMSKVYTQEEIMEVASKFFYCDKVLDDTSIQAHVCIGLNGIEEAKWEKDYVLLEAFCFEAIFNDLDKDNSEVWTAFITEKAQVIEKAKPNISSLEQYLENVKLNVFERMKSNEVLKKKLLVYYTLNSENLAFRIEN